MTDYFSKLKSVLFSDISSFSFSLSLLPTLRSSNYFWKVGREERGPDASFHINLFRCHNRFYEHLPVINTKPEMLRTNQCCPLREVELLLSLSDWNWSTQAEWGRGSCSQLRALMRKVMRSLPHHRLTLLRVHTNKGSFCGRIGNHQGSWTAEALNTCTFRLMSFLKKPEESSCQ